MKYYLTDGQNKVGPFSTRQIMEMLSQNKISVTDQICSDQDPNWLMIFQHTDFMIDGSEKNDSESKNNQGQSGFLFSGGEAVSNSCLNIKLEEEKTGKKVLDQWFLLNPDGRSRGPFSYLILLGMLQEKKLSDTDLVKKGNKDWLRVSEYPDFSPSVLSLVASNNPEIGQGPLNFRRHHDREETQMLVWVRRGQQILKAMCVDISQAGMAIVLRTTGLDKNDLVEIFLSQVGLQAGSGLKAMIKSKSAYENEVDKSIHQYGVHFLPNNEQHMEEVKELVKKVRQLNLASKKVS